MRHSPAMLRAMRTVQMRDSESLVRDWVRHRGGMDKAIEASVVRASPALVAGSTKFDKVRSKHTPLTATICTVVASPTRAMTCEPSYLARRRVLRAFGVTVVSPRERPPRPPNGYPVSTLDT